MNNPRNAFEVSSAQWRSTIGRVAVTLIILAVLLFVPAGRITWTRGWLFLLVFTLLMFGAIVYFRRVNPQMFAIRSRVHPETKRWDKVVIGLLFLAMFAIPLVAGLDDGRFHWSSMSRLLMGLGYLLLITGWIGVAWAETCEPVLRAGRAHPDRAWTPCD
jgi:hypothetical protein